MITFSIFAFHPVLYMAIIAALVLLTTARITRFFTSDTLGEWLLAPLKRWARSHELAEREANRQMIQEARRLKVEMILSRMVYVTDLEKALNDPEPISKQARLVSGLDCPFCIGFWVGAFVLVITVATFGHFTAFNFWLVIMAIFSINYIVGHISARLD